MVRGSVPRDQNALSRVQAARALAAGGHSSVETVAAARAGRDRSADRGRTRQHSGWRRGNTRGSGAQGAPLLRQGDRRRVARCDAARTSRRSAYDGDDDVRDRGDRRRTARASPPSSRAAG